MRGYGQYGTPLSGRSLFRGQGGAGRNTITPCIACNQACLDHTFGGKISSCLAAPQACYETELPMTKTDAAKRVAVIGAALLVWPPR